MSNKRKIEIFSAGCPACEETIKLVNENACSSCDIEILDVQKEATKNRMQSLGIKSIPTVVIDGKVADCCSKRGPNIEQLKSEGLGRS